MADIRTITILPSAGVPQVQGGVGAGAQGTASLAGIASGTILSGFIVNRDAGGNPILRTDTGDVTFSSNFFLNIGSEVAIRVENSAGGTLAHILTVNGQPPEIATSQSAFAQEPEVIISQNLSDPASQPQVTATAAASEPEQNTPTLTVTGTLVAQPQQSSDTTPPLPTGTQLTLKVTGLTNAQSTIPDEMLDYAPPSAPQQSSTATPPANPAFYTTYARAAGTTIAPTSAPVPAAPTATTEVTPEPVTVQVVTTTPQAPANNTAPLPPTTTTTAPVSQIPQQAQGFTATVISNESSRETNLQTPLGIIRLQPDVILPAGSTVKFTITNTTPPTQTTAANATLPTQQAPLTELAQQWTSLQQIVTLLTGRAPASGFNVVQDTMPWVMPPPTATQAAPTAQNVPAGLMLFMAALRGGSFSNWLGADNVKWLQDQGHATLVSKADGEFSLLARQFTEPVPGHWQALFFPVAVAGELQQARLFVKRDRKEGNNTPQGKKNDDTRFVVEVDLTQLGEMQMDGFVRRRDQEVQFDLVIRSLLPLSKEIQQDILTIYSATGELTGYKGSLAFQTVKDFPVNPMEEIVGQTETVVV